MSQFSPSVSIQLNDLTYSIAIVTAEFNLAITEKLEVGAVEALKQHGFVETQITKIRVPGAYEIPLTSKLLFDKGYDGIIALGCVIRGETTHYESVCEGCERGVMQVQLDYKRPIGFGVIMTENWQQAEDRAGGKHGNKGRDAAEAMLKILEIKENLNGNKKSKPLTKGELNDGKTSYT